MDLFSHTALPIPLGYYLVRAGIVCHNWPHVKYRGVDRLPYVPSPFEIDEWRDTGKKEIADLWDKYFNAFDDASLNTNRQFIQRVRKEFQLNGFEYDVIYVQLASIPNDSFLYRSGWPGAKDIKRAIEYLKSRPCVLPKQEDLFCGYDISYPLPSFHSAIFQPGFNEILPDLDKLLNINGLVNDIDLAVKLQNTANGMGYSLPFCVLGVWDSIGQDSTNIADVWKSHVPVRDVQNHG